MQKAKNRKERVSFLINKIGSENIINTLASMNDREVKKLFDAMYPIYKNKEDYVAPQFNPPTCLVCGSETVTHWECGCGNAIIDENDTALQELKDSGEYKRIQEQFRTI